LLIIGVPIFIATFIYGYIFGIDNVVNTKLLIEILIILIAYVELHDIEKGYKDHQEV
jgi:hypothetical protein